MSTPIDRTVDDPNALFRFALLLTGDADTAGNALLGAVKKCGPRISQIREAKRRRAMLLEQILALAPAATAARAERSPFQELPEDLSALSQADSALVPAIAQLPDPLRTAAAYFYSNLFSAEELPAALDWPSDRVAETLQQARHALLASLKRPSEQEQTV